MSKRIPSLVGVLLVCWFVSILTLRQYNTRNRLEVSSPELGRTVPIDVNYGKIVFVTQKEKNLRNLLNASVLVPLALYAGYLVAIAVQSASKKEIDSH